MALLDPLQPFIQEFYGAIREVLLEVPEPPKIGSPTTMYSIWFATLNYLALVRERPFDLVPVYVPDSMETLRAAFAEHLGVPLPPVFQRLTYAALAAWCGSGAVATAATTWCKRDPHQAADPMEIIRYDSPELSWICSDSNHDTDFEVDSTDSKIVKK